MISHFIKCSLHIINALYVFGHNNEDSRRLVWYNIFIAKRGVESHINLSYLYSLYYIFDISHHDMDTHVLQTFINVNSSKRIILSTVLTLFLKNA